MGVLPAHREMHHRVDQSDECDEHFDHLSHSLEVVVHTARQHAVIRDQIEECERDYHEDGRRQALRHANRMHPSKRGEEPNETRHAERRRR